jgi:hypothetical protein
LVGEEWKDFPGRFKDVSGKLAKQRGDGEANSLRSREAGRAGVREMS